MQFIREKSTASNCTEMIKQKDKFVHRLNLISKQTWNLEQRFELSDGRISLNYSILLPYNIPCITIFLLKILYVPYCKWGKRLNQASAITSFTASSPATSGQHVRFVVGNYVGHVTVTFTGEGRLETALLNPARPYRFSCFLGTNQIIACQKRNVLCHVSNFGVRSFGMIRIRIRDPRSLGWW